MRASRDLRPIIHSAIHQLLRHNNADVRDAAPVAALSLPEHPVLNSEHGELADHARRLLIAGTDRYKRDLVLEALTAWGPDISSLENADDVVVAYCVPGGSPSAGRAAATKTHRFGSEALARGLTRGS
ncbi:hypothetical protein [Streptomyces sp. NPDC005548]|uniref:hypothetical protein n=1 Tax=Streptomyces sp. NPDC005548 TaxID=3364724 RepID=UPI00369AFE6B